VPGDGRPGDEQLPGDLLGREPVGGQRGDLPFPVGQLSWLREGGDLPAQRLGVGDRERDDVVERRAGTAREQRVEPARAKGRLAGRDRRRVGLLQGGGAA
jgi:hypothetical protein